MAEVESATVGDTQGQSYYFDDYVLGEEHEAGSHHVTADDIISFAKTWDPQPWHIDLEAAESSIFGRLTACSAHIFSIFCITSQRWKSGVVQQAIAGLGFDEMRMHKPVFAGDTLHCLSTIEELRDSSSRPNAGIVSYRTTLINQDGEMVFSIGSASLMAKDPKRMSEGAN